LLEASVFGRRAGYAIAEFIKSGAQLYPMGGSPIDKQQKRIETLMDKSSVNGNAENVAHVADELKANMTENCGIYRDGEKLELAKKTVLELQERFKNARVMDTSRRFNTDVLAGLETEHLLQFSEVIVEGALARTESRGAHSRTDFKKRDDEDWLRHTVAHQTDDGHPTLSYRPVNIDWEKYPPQERKY
jgi:succinate dehydrogenase/fumarate reductase flavoprotein subunit